MSGNAAEEKPCPTPIEHSLTPPLILIDPLGLLLLTILLLLPLSYLCKYLECQRIFESNKLEGSLKKFTTFLLVIFYNQILLKIF